MRTILAFFFIYGVATVTAQALDCVSTKRLSVDADGAPDSYRVDGRGLSNTCDGVFAIVDGVARTPLNDRKHWYALCRSYWQNAEKTKDYSKVKIVGFLTEKSGEPRIQGVGDPLPGQAYVTTTKLTIQNTPENSQRHYVNASEIPYVVLSSSYAEKYRLSRGDLVAVYRPKTGAIAYGVYGDCCRLGEASIRLHQDLGSNPIVVQNGVRRAKRNIEDPVYFIALTGAHTTPTLDSAAWRKQIAERGQQALTALGGINAVKACNAGKP
ncbi:glycoside hydrolase family 75 protein [Segnochrobactrum spirostomi]|uniref:SH3 domain-containing protein n=1 Tax=Segnochrobactrum spirostomi TaxID=2608987 RepID=A0A6A7Y113_9HYPH|nr:glycoside hydrolase family 75 protein [Segnochrobactrum spirostomi]MQT11619.1 hypothetical protein [Segnochrobactrum spirostomi]